MVSTKRQSNRAIETIAVVLLCSASASALAQTVEDAHVQHTMRLADTALNAQYHATMAVMAVADRSRDANLKDGSRKPDSQPTYQAALTAAERAWLTYRDAHCASVSLAFRGGVYAAEAAGKCIADLARKRTVELKELAASMNE